MNLKLSLLNSNAIRNSRLPWIDYARGIAILLVLYRHVFIGIKISGADISHYPLLEKGNIMFFSFRMPLFFMLSGVFLGVSLAKRGLGHFVETKWKTLLYPYLIWGLFQITLQFALKQYVNAGRTWWDYLYIIYRPREIDQFWYLYALFNTSVLYAIIRAKLRLTGFYQLLIGLVMFYISGLLVRNDIHIGFVHDVIHYYIYIAVGDNLSSFILDKKNVPLFSSWKLFAVSLPIFAAAQYYFLVTNLAHAGIDGAKADYFNYVEDWQPLLFLVIAFSGCIFMINISFILQRYHTFILLRFIGYHSLYIYLTHVLAASVTRIVLTKVFGITDAGLLFICGMVMALVIPLALYLFAMKKGAWWLFSLERPAERKKDASAAAGKVAASGA